MREKIILLASVIIFTTSGILVGQVTTDDAWINEFHYDNDGADVNEFVEIVIKDVSSYDLSLFNLVLYNGTNGEAYEMYLGNDPDVTIGETLGNYSFVQIPTTGMQNGAPDGIALSYNGVLIQFLSYEGSFTAIGGPADGITSVDVGVSESSAAISESLQLSGSGYSYSDFTWSGPISDSPGQINTGQYLFPTLEFNVASAGVSENVSSIDIGVKLNNPDGNTIDVDVIFQQDPSTAEEADFSSSINQTVSFGADATEGEIQSASFTLNNDMEYEGLEKAEFILVNVVSTGLAKIVGQSEFILSIEDNETPNVVINEIHADPDPTNGDADGDGNSNTDDDEFVEIVNVESVNVNITGWTISDAQGRRHTFSDNTILPANGVAVVFGGFNSTGNFGGAIVQDTTSLGLNNGGDTVTLKDALGNTIDEHTYGSEGGDDQSLVRNPDITGSFVKHSDAPESPGTIFSPGTKTDGAIFSTNIVIDGTAGWRMLSAPVENMPISEIMDDVPIQGIDDLDDKNFYTGYNGSVFTSPSDLLGNINSGEGFILYVFNNNEFNSKTLPVNIDVGTNSEPSGDVTVSLHASGDHWNLLGNPYQTAFDMTTIVPTGGTLGSAVGHIWSNTDGSYILTSLNDDRIAPGQGFFMQNDEINPATSITLPISGKTSGTRFYKSVEAKGFVQLALLSETETDGHVQKDLSTVLYFHESAEAGEDEFDAEKLYPLKLAYSLLGFNNPDADMLKTQDSRSYFGEDEENFELGVLALNVKPNQTIKWERASNIPEEWEFLFIDKQTGEEIEMNENFVYSFQFAGEPKAKNIDHGLFNNPVSVENKKSESRFTIVLKRGMATSNKPGLAVPEQFMLEQNYPNPFNPVTQIRYDVPMRTKVNIEVFNLMGQKVATLVDQIKPPGTYRAVWDASSQASGVYYYRLKADNTIIARKMTLIK